jgi:hypothetical protein
MKEAPAPAECQAAAAQHRDLLLYNYTADEIGHNVALYEGMKQWAAPAPGRHQNLVTVSPTPELYETAWARAALRWTSG